MRFLILFDTFRYKDHFIWIGDATEIGEKGINLSGGQKQRINLARAVYATADIYLLDDILSSVDTHVGRDIFDKVIGPGGLLKDRTRILVTNSLSFIEEFDRILMLDNGEVIENGTFEELVKCDGPFNEFIKRHYKAKDQQTNVQEIEDSVDSEITQKAPNKLTDGSVINNIIINENIQQGKVKLFILSFFFKSLAKSVL